MTQENIELVVDSTQAKHIVHIRVNGRTFEECNVDQIRHKSFVHFASIRDAAEYAQSRQYELCERCFYDA